MIYTHTRAVKHCKFQGICNRDINFQCLHCSHYRATPSVLWLSNICHFSQVKAAVKNFQSHSFNFPILLEGTPSLYKSESSEANLKLKLLLKINIFLLFPF